jgi:1,4-alpha-glucan branching enzyme
LHDCSTGNVYQYSQLLRIQHYSIPILETLNLTLFFLPWQYLIDTAHGLGMKVFMDVVHAHASDNSDDGLNHFDGTDSHYFHDDPQKGWHSLWGTRMFNYGSYETLRFLLSNLKYWQTEFKFDGFRFDGVTAMLYNHRGIHWDFHGGVNEFYGEHADDDACAYLMLANKMLREDEETVIGLDGVEKTSKNKSVTTIAEEVSGQPGVCRPVWHGGLGFDLRLSMGPPDKWGQLAHEPDFNWSPSRIVEICTSRTAEPAVGYLESHDQSLVGDKTFAFRLMDGAMYACMGKFKPEGLPEHQDWQVHPQIERGVALHKIARLLTLTLAGEAWMGFMGNEFGHPDWVDFPREGNGESFAHARRQWSLRDVNGAGKGLFYHDLERFDAALLKCDASHGLLVANKNEERKRVHHIKDDTGVLAFHCGTNLIVCNLHPHESYPYYKVGSEFGGKYKLVLDTDATEFGGHGRLAANQSASTENGACDWQGTGVCLYLPSRSAQVYALIDTWDVPDELYSTHTDNDFGYGSDGGDDTGGGGDDAVW